MRWLALLFLAIGLQAQLPRPIEVQERRLGNGMRLLVVERRSLEAFHATLVFRGGRAEEPSALLGATDLLARAMFSSTWKEDLEGPRMASGLDALLKQEEGLLEALRVERLRVKVDPGGSPQIASLDASLQALQGRLQERFSSTPLSDLYLARGGRQSAEATDDALYADTELPGDAFEFWCQTEGQRLRAIRLSRFSQARTELQAEIRTRGPQEEALIRGAALPGLPYGRDLLNHQSGIEAIRWSDLKAQARRILAPDRLTLILIGGIAIETALPLVERHFGSLPPSSDLEDSIQPEIPAALGDRHIQASLPGPSRLLVAWRIPPRSHGDHLPLRFAAELIGGGSTGRLASRLTGPRKPARFVDLHLDVPGGRWPSLLLAKLQPATGRGLAELDSALHSEILRLQQEPIAAEEWQRVMARLETTYLQTQDEPAALARALGKAWVETGDWRALDLDMQRMRRLEPEAVQAAARTWLGPTHRTTARIEPTPGDHRDPIEAEAARLLTALSGAHISDPAQREQLVLEGLRQIRMLSPEERQRTLKLLNEQLRQAPR